MTEIGRQLYNAAHEHVGTQLLWADLLVEELVRQGVGLFVVAPGSRSTPLVLAVAKNSRANSLVHFDERGGALAAVGYVRGTGRPAAWITTSGTAVANGLPAVVEADASGIPLLLLTADRPPELRETGANQTIRQHGIFGQYVRWEADLPVPDGSIDPAFVLTTAGQAVQRAVSQRGPVQLNCMFREPFVGDHGSSDPVTIQESLRGWQESGHCYTTYTESISIVPHRHVENLASRIEGIEKGLIVAGQLDAPESASAVSGLARVLGWPLLADVTSNVRAYADELGLAHDLILGSERFRDQVRPDVVLHFGGKVASKRLQTYIQQTKPPSYIVVRTDAIRFDPDHIVSERIQADIPAFCSALGAELVPSTGQSEWMNAWKNAAHAVETTISEQLDAEDLNEPAVARAVSGKTPEGHGLVLASSMPIRDMDTFAVRNGPMLRIAANRGASGIDGTVATAAGFARGIDCPVTLLIGDLALLHDLNSLSILADGPPVTIVVLNNDGGGIFHFLSIADQKDVFERYFGTPHGLHFEQAARMFGMTYVRPGTLPEFVSAYTHLATSGKASIIEVCTDRSENVQLHKRLIAEAASAADRTLNQ